MESEREGKEYSWAWVTADQLLSHGQCELVYACFTGDTDAGSFILYDGENANGRIIVTKKTGGLYNCEFSPRKPVYCRRGLFVGSLTTGDVFIQWRELGEK